MARAYVQFAVAHPSRYRVVFGGLIESAPKDDHFVAEAKAAFQLLVDALVEQQNACDIGRTGTDGTLRLGNRRWHCHAGH
jgi:hypothetical protein